MIGRLLRSLERIADTMEAAELRERLNAHEATRLQVEQNELLRKCQDQNNVALERRVAWEKREIEHMAICERRFHDRLRQEAGGVLKSVN